MLLRAGARAGGERGGELGDEEREGLLAHSGHEDLRGEAGRYREV